MWEGGWALPDVAAVVLWRAVLAMQRRAHHLALVRIGVEVATHGLGLLWEGGVGWCLDYYVGSRIGYCKQVWIKEDKGDYMVG